MVVCIARFLSTRGRRSISLDAVFFAFHAHMFFSHSLFQLGGSTLDAPTTYPWSGLPFADSSSASRLDMGQYL